MSLEDRYPRLRGRQVPKWVAEWPDAGSPIQAARDSFLKAADALERGPAPVVVAECTCNCDNGCACDIHSPTEKNSVCDPMNESWNRR